MSTTDALPRSLADLELEKAVLGAVLLEPRRLDDVRAVGLAPQHFWAMAHGTIYQAMLAVAAAGGSVHPRSVARQLGEMTGKNGKRVDLLDKAGGLEYLLSLVELVSSGASAAYDAQRVLALAGRRAVKAAAEDVARQIGTAGADPEAELGQLEQSLLHALRDLTHRPTFAPIQHWVSEAYTQFERIQTAGAIGLKTGFHDLDRLSGGILPGSLVLVAGRPSMGKTTLAMGIAENVARAGNRVLVCSIEVSGDVLAGNLICSMAGLSVSVARSGRLGAGAWENLAGAAGTAAGLPILVDANPEQTIAGIALSARRAQQDGPLALLVIDYIQLLRPAAGAKYRSRYEEVTEISRDLKGLARLLDVPVLAVSQLNREAEKRKGRTGARPQLSDLRDCLAGDTGIYDARTGAWARVSDLASGSTSVVAAGLGSDWKIRTAPIAEAWSVGVKPLVRVRTRTGREMRCTTNHPVRTLEGWTKIADLAVDDCIAVPRWLPEPAVTSDTDRRWARLLGYLVADGTYLTNRSVEYVKADPAQLDEVERLARALFGFTVRPRWKAGTDATQLALTDGACGPGGNPVINSLKAAGIHGQPGPDKHVPSCILQGSNAVVASFLGALWSGDGTVVPKRRSGWVLKYCSTSRAMLHEIQRLLLRFGILSILRPPTRNTKSTTDIATVEVGERDSLLRFCQHIPLTGAKRWKLRRAERDLQQSGENAHIDRLPKRVTEIVQAEKENLGLSWSELGYRCQGKRIGRESLASAAAVLERPDLEDLAASDVLWDPIVAIEPDREEECFDLRVPGLGNFVANGIFVHNSGAIEQDADQVMLLYRPEYYQPEVEETRGLAEVILAKNRHGPTGTVRLAFSGEQLRFRNLAQDWWDAPAVAMPAHVEGRDDAD